MDLNKVKKLNIPESPGCYQFLDRDGKIIYIGKAANLRDRVFSYWRKNANHTPAKLAMLKQIVKIKWILTDSEIEALLLESNLVKKHQPQFNVLLRDDKRFVYIKISLEDEIPGVFVTRKIVRAGKYFGPFVSAIAVRETVKAIRKIWPYCTERRIKGKLCFYAQIGRCLGVCGKEVSKKEYRDKVIKPITLFLEGRKERIVKSLKLKVKSLGREIKRVRSDEKRSDINEETSRLEFQLKNIQQVLQHTNIINLIDKYAADVVELAKVLGLSRVPKRIEGYDISNIFGKEAVGSMVVFVDGEPDKNEYRKFKIRVGQGEANDVGMLKEVLERRLRHSVESKRSSVFSVISIVGERPPSVPQAEIPRRSADAYLARDDKDSEWPLPDLIIIDGAKAQANVALRVLKKYKLVIPLIAVSKGKGLRSSVAPDKLFFAGEKKSLQLPLASPAMHIIKRVRDEAHRFAISYHRKLRSKDFFK